MNEFIYFPELSLIVCEIIYTMVEGANELKLSLIDMFVIVVGHKKKPSLPPIINFICANFHHFQF